MRHGIMRSILLLALGCTLFGQSSPAALESLSREKLGFVALDRIIQPITTIIEFADGKKEFNLGNGFIVGKRYFTVYHNLKSYTPSASARKTIYLDGVPITPSYMRIEEDIAVFDLPDVLCDKYCNNVSFGEMPELGRDRKVYWLRKFNGEMALREGKVLHYAVMGNAPTASEASATQGCHVNLIVEVDTPFLQGSSGAPVLDATTGQIIGIIQGSIESAGGRSGYFKPINCVTPFQNL